MADRLMTNEELKRVTGKQRYSKQAEWFRQKNAVVLTWDTF
ncbi:DUF4224 domain-containing protein [Paraburkholderia sp. RL18-101-BIB-B]